MTGFMVIAGLLRNGILLSFFGALVGGLSMGAGSMLGGLIGGATLGWKRGRTVTVAFLCGAVPWLFLFLAVIAMAMERPPASRLEPWTEVLSMILLQGAAGGIGGVLGAGIARALSRAIRRGAGPS